MGPAGLKSERTVLNNEGAHAQVRDKNKLQVSTKHQKAVIKIFTSNASETDSTVVYTDYRVIDH